MQALRNALSACALLLVGGCQSAALCPPAAVFDQSGYADIGGSLLSNQKYGIQILCGRDRYRVLLQEIVRYEGQYPVWKTLAEQTISARPGQVILGAECQGPPFDFVVLARHPRFQKPAEVLRAWRINLETFRFEAITPTGIICELEQF